MHQRQRQRYASEAEVAEVEVAEAEAAEAELAEAEGCIGGGSMHRKHQNALEEHRGRWS
jgi:hypothetical protein